ncbi:MAG: GlgC family sugar phosphate nucleotidyltransferase, partial [Candidatus Aminicenantales bacterium]
SLIDSQRVFAYTFDDYWEDIGTIDAYWEANMAFVSPSPPPILKDPAWPVRSYRPQYPPTFVSGCDLRASIIGPGCSFTDCRIVKSIIAPGVRVEPGAEVIDSILFENITICRGARLHKVIIDKRSTIPEGFEIGFDADKDGREFKISRTGIRVVPKGWT